MPRTTKNEKRREARDAIAGLTKRLVAEKPYKMSGKTYSRDTLIAVFQSHLDALQALDLAHIAVGTAGAKERTIARAVKALTSVLKAFVANEFGDGPEVLADFGWKRHRKPGPKTTLAKVTGARKAKATKEARGTTGKGRRRR